MWPCIDFLNVFHDKIYPCDVIIGFMKMLNMCVDEVNWGGRSVIRKHTVSFVCTCAFKPRYSMEMSCQPIQIWTRFRKSQHNVIRFPLCLQTLMAFTEAHGRSMWAHSHTFAMVHWLSVTSESRQCHLFTVIRQKYFLVCENASWATYKPRRLQSQFQVPTSH